MFTLKSTEVIMLTISELNKKKIESFGKEKKSFQFIIVGNFTNSVPNICYQDECLIMIF